MPAETIGFIGLGNMGHGMAKNIVEKGFALTVLGRRNRTPIEDLVERGAKEAKSVAELAAASSIVVLCVTASRDVEALAKALKPALRPGSVIIDTSTSDPNSTLALAADFAAAGVDFVDAPLSRTPERGLGGHARHDGRRL